ncbi:MAG: HU family DNA-binding protein [Balneolaceae bacterium]|nr:HU family DNA-binding protein [Balneolaceae bacterium]
MKINREQLVELLVQRTGLQKKQAEEQLTELIKRIREAAEEDKDFEIEKFGTFRMEEGQLTFVPSEELQTEINNKYAGMEPIELIGSYEQGEEPGEPEAGDATDSGTDTEASQAGEKEQKEETAAAREHKPGDGDSAGGDEEKEKVWPDEENIWGWDADADTDTDEDIPDNTGEEQPSGTGDQTEQPESAGGEQETGSPEKKLDSVFEYDDEQSEEPAENTGEESDDLDSSPVQEPDETELPAPEPVSAADDDPEKVEEEDDSGQDRHQDESAPEEEQAEEDEKKKPAATGTAAGTKDFGKRHTRKRTSSTSVVMIAAASVIVIAIAVWLAFDMGVFSDGTGGSTANQNNQSGAAVATERTRQPVQNADPGNETATQPDQQNDNEPGAETAEPEPQNQVATGEQEQEPDSEPEISEDSPGNPASIYGLKGSLREEANDGYTIIVHSMKNEQNAREVYSQFKLDGYRTMLVSAMVNGEQFWRIGLGQFRNVENAQDSAATLPEPYNDNFFIKRIR